MTKEERGVAKKIDFYETFNIMITISSNDYYYLFKRASRF